MEDILAASIVLCAGETGDAGVIVEAQGSSPGVGVTARAGVAETVLSDHWEPSCSERDWDPQVTDGNLFGVVCPGAGTKVSSMTCDRSSCISVVMLVAASQEYFAVGCIKEGGGEDVRRIEAMGASLLGFTLERLTHRSNILWQGLLSAGSGNVNHMASHSPFRPLGHTT